MAQHHTPSSTRPRRDDVCPSIEGRLIALYAVLSCLNIGGWAWAALAFRGQPTLLGIALVVYGLGLRHAVDADHIAAIDSVTRKLMQSRQRPVAVGFFFALGHSTVVVIIATLVATATLMVDQLREWAVVGSIVGSAVSAAFLLLIGIMNLAVFGSVYRTYKRVRAGGVYPDAQLDRLATGQGLVARMLRPLFALVTSSWHMVLLGFLFGLGFDTATEVSMFGISAAQAGNGLPLVSLLVFPVLFTAGMSLADTTDGVLMLGAYEWAYVQPLRKLHYNLAVTLVSAAVALLVGGIELLGLIGEQASVRNPFWSAIDSINAHFTAMGYAIVGLFLAFWAVSFTIFRLRPMGRTDGAKTSRV